MSRVRGAALLLVLWLVALLTALIGAPVVKLSNASSYVCRNRYNGTNTKLSEHALANALERMLDDPDLARRLGASGRLRCERELNLDVQRTRFLTVVRKRMESSAGP